MKRIVSIWLMNFSLDCLKRRQQKAEPWSRSNALDDSAFALTLNRSGNTFISAVNTTACDAGVHCGMRLTDARALLPSLSVREGTPIADIRALHQLAEWCQRYSPITATYGEDALWIDITGVSHLFGGEQNMLCDIVNRLDALGFSCRIGLAATPGAAFAIARFSPKLALKDRIIPEDGDLKSGLASFSAEALRLNPNALYMLQRFGLRTIGALAHIPRASLKRRFSGDESGQLLCSDVLLRLDQAFGLIAEPLTGLTPLPAYWERHACAEPVAATESFHLILRELMCRLCEQMEQRRIGARRLTFSAFHADGHVSRTSTATARASRDTEHLVRLFRDHIEKLNPGFGVDVLILSADTVENLGVRQLSLSNADQSQQNNEEIDALIDRLSNRLGAGNIQVAVSVESHIPERAEERVSVLRRSRTSCPQGKCRTPLRPLCLLPRPEVITVSAEIPEGPPRCFTWRRVRHQIIRAEGPERIAPEWWHVDLRSDERTRDYYRIETEHGHRFWVFREGLCPAPCNTHKPRWHMHGLFA